MRQPAERTQTVIDRDDDGAFLGKLFAVITGLGAGPAGQAGAVNPDHHRQTFRGGTRRGPDVEKETIFAGWLRGGSTGGRLPAALTACRPGSPGAASSSASPLHAPSAVLVGL